MAGGSQWTPIVALQRPTGPGSGAPLSTHGQLQLSCCVLREDDFKADPTLPRHVYDLEVQMWAELHAQRLEGKDKDAKLEDGSGGSYLQKKADEKRAADGKLVRALGCDVR